MSHEVWLSFNLLFFSRVPFLFVQFWIHPFVHLHGIRITVLWCIFSWSYFHFEDIMFSCFLVFFIHKIELNCSPFVMNNCNQLARVVLQSQNVKLFLSYLWYHVGIQSNVPKKLFENRLKFNLWNLIKTKTFSKGLVDYSVEVAN